MGGERVRAVRFEPNPACLIAWASPSARKRKIKVQIFSKRPDRQGPPSKYIAEEEGVDSPLQRPR